MVTITDSKGQKTQAFDLVMKKDLAMAILDGSKTIEFRSYSDFYISRFLQNAKDIKAGKENLPYQPYEVFFVHFHDYGKTWYLDVAIEAVDLWSMHEDSLPYLHEHNCHEMDELIAENKAKGLNPYDEGIQWAFCLPISAIISTSIDCSNIKTIRKMDIPDEFVIK